MGFDGFEILQKQLSSWEPAVLMKIKRRAFLLGIDLMGYIKALTVGQSVSDPPSGVPCE